MEIQFSISVHFNPRKNQSKFSIAKQEKRFENQPLIMGEKVNNDLDAFFLLLNEMYFFRNLLM